MDSTASILSLCSGPEAEDLTSALKMLGQLTEVLGVCSRDPVIRQCNTEAALECITDLGTGVLDYHKTGYVQAVCS